MFELTTGQGGITPEFGDAQSGVGSSNSGGYGITTGDKYFTDNPNAKTKVSDQFLLGTMVAVMALYVIYKKL